MNFFEKYLGDTFELVETLKESAQDFVAVVYDKHVKRLCVMKQRALSSRPIYQLLQELKEPHIPKIYRLFEFEGKLFVVEEHIDGQTLEELMIYRADELDEDFAANVIVSLCECLKVMHAKNIIHRDIKPSNIMLTEARGVKLIDFGIARLFKPDGRADTELLGTRGYAPPEQFGLFDLGQTDSRSDIYSLGVTIKQLLGGEDYRGKLSGILNRCTSPDPSQRFQSADDLRSAVLRYRKFGRLRELLFALSLCLAIMIIPQVAEDLTPPVEVPDDSAQVQTPVVVEEKIAESPPPDDSKVFVPLPDLITTPPPLTLPELPSQPVKPPQPVEQPSGRVELKLYLNGELTGKEHMIYLRGWQSWSRDEYGQVLFPPSMTARLRIENHSGKDLINPRIEVNVGYDEYTVDEPTIERGQSRDLSIPLGGQMASPEEGSGHLTIVVHVQGEPPIMLGKTFFLVK